MTDRPFMFRWLYAVQDDDRLSGRAKTAAVPIFRHANMNTGRGCSVGTSRAAAETGSSEATIKRGWAELVAAGYLTTTYTRASVTRTTGAARVAVFPRVPLDGLDVGPDGRHDRLVRITQTRGQDSTTGLTDPSTGLTDPVEAHREEQEPSGFQEPDGWNDLDVKSRRYWNEFGGRDAYRLATGHSA